MLYRVAAPLLSTVPRPYLSDDSDSAYEGILRDRECLEYRHYKVLNWNSRECSPEHSSSFNLVSHASLFPSLASFVSPFISFLGHQCQRLPWPPLGNIQRSEWMYNLAIPFLPQGKETEVVMSRLNLPFSSFRVTILGPRYMRALSILSQRDDDGGSETSWPQTETSFLMTDISSSEYEIVPATPG